MMDSIARKPSSTSSVVAFLSVKVLPRRRLPLLELACLPSAASPRVSSFTSLQSRQTHSASGDRTRGQAIAGAMKAAGER